jgi:hypothetical protein
MKDLHRSIRLTGCRFAPLRHGKKKRHPARTPGVEVCLGSALLRHFGGRAALQGREKWTLNPFVILSEPAGPLTLSLRGGLRASRKIPGIRPSTHAGPGSSPQISVFLRLMDRLTCAVPTRRAVTLAGSRYAPPRHGKKKRTPGEAPGVEGWAPQP